MVWEVKCARCDSVIETDSVDDIERDVNDDPICDDCPYAEEPDYPVTVSFTVRRDETVNESLIRDALPHFEPYLDEGDWMALPEGLGRIGSGTHITLKLTKTDREQIESEVIAVNHEPVASAIEKKKYECEECGTKIQAYAVTDEDMLNDYRPLTHYDCPESRSRGSFIEIDENV